MKKKIKMIMLACLSVLFFLSLAPVYAADSVDDAGSKLEKTVGLTGVAKTDIPTAAGEVIRIALLLVGIAFFILTLYAGIRWMTARGAEEAVTKARNTLVAAVIGLVIVVGAYAGSMLITTSLLKGVNPSSSQAGSLQTPEGEGLVIGCCIDKVRRRTELLEQANEHWTMRMTTKDDCRYYGETPMDYDVLVGSGTWEWSPQNAERCQERFNEIEEDDSL